jgi:hypothetical protein
MKNIVLLLALSFVLAFEARAYDLINENRFYDGISFGSVPKILLVDSSEVYSADKVSDQICKNLGFARGASEFRVEDLDVQRWIGLNAIAVDFPRSQFKLVLLASLFTEVPNTRKYFSKLDCYENETTLDSLAISIASHSEEARQISLAKELEIFQEIKTSPGTLLSTFYHEPTTQVLALGESNHRNHQIYLYILTLLQEVGLDPALKFIVVERDPSYKEAYEVASHQPIDSGFLEKYAPSEKEKATMFGGPAFQGDRFFMSTMFPLIAQLNKQRTQDNPITVVPIDGNSGDEIEKLFPTAFPDVIRKLNIHGHGDAHRLSWYRENATQNRFREQILKNLKEGEKAIVIYHLGHLLNGVQANYPHFNFEENIWETASSHPSSWLSMAFSENMGLRDKTKIVSFDERDEHFGQGWALNGTFVLTQRLIKECPNESFAFLTKPFEGIPLEKGLSVFDPGTSFHTWFKGLLSSNSDLSQMTDAIIWSHGAGRYVDHPTVDLPELNFLQSSQ